MACGGCKKNTSTSQPSTTRGTSADLSKFAYLTPRQLRFLEEQGKKVPDKE
jgi:hypothetical protein